MSDNLLAHIADRVVNRPLMIMPEKLAMISSVLEGRIGIDASKLREISSAAQADGVLPLPTAARGVGTFELVDPTNPQLGRKPYRTTRDGVAVIEVFGSLVNRGSWIDALSNVTSYEKIKRDVGMAADDAAVTSIVLEIDSPGGEAIGAFEAGDAVAAAATKKTLVAVANGLCCSAAYAIAAGAPRIVVSPSALVGSVGVVLLHLDHSNRLHAEGIVPTLIQAGARKTDGSSYKPMTEDVRGELQAEVFAFMDLFVAGVNRGRPGMTEETIRATEARTYIGQKAVDVGLADAVGTFESVISELSSGAGANRPTLQSSKGFRTMNDKTNPEAITQATVDAAVATAKTAAHAEGVKVGATQERARFAAVTGHEHFAGRESTALTMLSTTDMTAEAISGVLATVPKAGPAAVVEPLKPEGRSKDAPNGVATVDGVEAGGGKDLATMSEFDKGKAKAKAALGKMN